jgi:hypothetical protein
MICSRLELTNCFSSEREEGSPCHYGISEDDSLDEVKIRGLFNTVKVLFQKGCPKVPWNRMVLL